MINKLNKTFVAGSKLPASTLQQMSDTIDLLIDEHGNKQDRLIDKENIKTVNGQSVLGSGNIEINAKVDNAFSKTSTNPVENKVVTQKFDELVASIASGGIQSPVTMSEYEAIPIKKNTLYFIVEGGRLTKIYYKSTLIAKRGETPSNIGFPYTFPIVFS